MELQWYALYTRPRFERKVASQLTGNGFQAWLPMQTVVRQWSDRKKKLKVPLFSGYIFVRTERLRLAETVWIEGVVRFVTFNNEPASIREEQLEFIKKLMAGPESFEIKERLFSKGEMIRVVNGVFKGTVGRWIRWKGRKRVAIQIDQISHTIIVEIPAIYIEKINTAHATEIHSTSVSGL